MELKRMIQECQMKISPQYISTKTLKSKTGKSSAISFVSWDNCCVLLDVRLGLGAWSWEVVDLKTTVDRIFVIGKLTLYGDDRTLSHSATGTELLNVVAYGDPSSNAEAMAFKRACMKFGLGRYLLTDKKNRAQGSAMTTGRRTANSYKF